MWMTAVGDRSSLVIIAPSRLPVNVDNWQNDTFDTYALARQKQ